MKKLFTLTSLLLALGMLFSGCKKDDTASENFITIEGTFTVGDKTYTNPTFDLGKPESHIGYLSFYENKSEPDGYISVGSPKGEDIDLGEGNYMYYRLKAYTTVVGETADTYFNVEIFNENEEYFELYRSSLTVKITKIGEVGGYIEGTYQGTLTENSGLKPEVVEYPVTGKFKVKRIALNNK